MRIIEFSTYIVGKKIFKMVSNTKNDSDTIISVVLLQKWSVNVYIVFDEFIHIRYFCRVHI